jgi:hypothetical protein
MARKEGTPNMTPQKPRQRTDLLIQDLGDEYLLYDAKGKTLHVLNMTAYTVWGLCDGQHTPDQMVDALFERFDCQDPRPQVQRDVEETLAIFAEKGLLDGSA